MPVLSDFQPGGHPGEAATILQDSTQSWMKLAQERKMQDQEMRIREQQAQQQKDQFIAQLPVIKAQAKAQYTSAVASIENHAANEDLKAKAAAASIDANKEFIAASQLTDWQAQSSEFSRLQAKYSWMANAKDAQGQPIYGGFLKTIDEARANAVTRWSVDETLKSHEDIARQNNEARMTGYAAGLEGRKYAADQGASSRVAAAQVSAGGRKDAAAGAMARAEVRAFNQSAIEADREALKFAEGGNEDEAAKARHRANAFRIAAKAKAAEATSAEGDAAPAAEAKPAPAAPAPAAAPRKLYIPPERDDANITFAPGVKEPADILKATQQALDDGAIDEEKARELLTNLGFKKKGE